jgi:hypothetical protein
MPEPIVRQAIKLWNSLSNGQGGIDWSGFELVCETLGVEDIELLPFLMCEIKNHQKSKD